MASGGPRDTTAFEVREALAQASCPICRLALRSVGKFLTSMAYERVNDVDLRATLRAGRGFCNPHAYRWLREAQSVLGTALIYRDIIRAAVADLAAGDAPASRGGLLDRLRGRPDARREPACPACAAQHEAEERYLDALAAVLADPAEVARYEQSDGVCLSHAQTLARRAPERGEVVVAHARRRADRLVATLDEVIRKEDYRFRHEPRSEAERHAPAEAVAWTIGRDGLV